MRRQLIRAALPLLLLPTVLGPAAPAQAGKPFVGSIVLPGATSAEGVAAGAGNTFFAGDLFAGDIFRGDVRAGTASLFIDAPAGRQALGMKVDVAHHLLFVAGGFTGQAYVYDTRTGATVATYQMGTPGSSIINDVALTPQGAWFTDSAQAHLLFVPVSGNGQLGAFVTLPVTGPAADTGDAFNLNGIAATPSGHTLIVAHSGNAELYTVDPQTGASALIAGVSVPNVDGIVLRGRDHPLAARRPPHQWRPRADHHEPALRGTHHGRPLRQRPRGGQRQVRHGTAADGDPVRGDSRPRVVVCACYRLPRESDRQAARRTR
jgi:hypothetical protein